MGDLREEFDKYKVWAGNVGAPYSRKHSQISLDYRLREASFYKTHVLRLLNTLAKTLLRALELSNGESRPFEETRATVDDGEVNDEEEVEDDSPWEISSSSSESSSQITHSTTTAPKLLSTKYQNFTSALSSSNQQLFVGRLAISEIPQLFESIKYTIVCLYKIPVRRPAPIDRIKH